MVDKLLLIIVGLFLSYGVLAETHKKIAFVSLMGGKLRVVEFNSTRLGDEGYYVNMPELSFDDSGYYSTTERAKKVGDIKIVNANDSFEFDEEKILLDGKISGEFLNYLEKVGKKHGVDRFLVMFKSNIYKEMYFPRGVTMLKDIKGYGFHTVEHVASVPSPLYIFMSSRIIYFDVLNKKIIKSIVYADSHQVDLLKVFDDEYKEMIFKYVTDGIYDESVHRKFRSVLNVDRFDEEARKRLLSMYASEYSGLDEYEEMTQELLEIVSEKYSYLGNFKYITSKIRYSINTHMRLAQNSLVSYMMNELFPKKKIKTDRFIFEGEKGDEFIF